MERNFVFESNTFDGHENLAVDEWFLDHVGDEDLILYFYQNENAVIIGKNQNPWLECDLDAMARDGVQLVRRVSGGGAVYHDMGNLNFSFIAGKARYDLDRQLSLVLKAVRSLGLEASFSGRNDLVWEGKKFSGNAFADRKGAKQHHGTLLISSDLSRLGNYLTPDPKKISSKGIASVRSRVCNLSEGIPDLTVKTARKAVIREFEREYGYFAEWSFCAKEKEELAQYHSRHASDAWRLGQTPKFDLEWKERFPWGSLQLLFSFEKGKIAKVEAYSDAMDPTICQQAEALLTGLEFTNEAICAAFASSSSESLRSLANEKFV